MKYFGIFLLGILLMVGCSATKGGESPKTAPGPHPKTANATDMKLGAFSMSLSVKDLATSKAFYENLGFTVKGGRMEDNYLVMKNGNALIGLFQGMFEGNIITFNPGWDENGNNADPFTDIRDIQKHMKAKGIQLDMEADENTKGPASVMLKDPDGNVILMDQFR
ncbi:MAG: VOC family protein [Bacteroidia bacterium]